MCMCKNITIEGEVGGGKDFSELIDRGGAISDGSVSRSSLGSPCCVWQMCVHVRVSVE